MTRKSMIMREFHIIVLLLSILSAASCVRRDRIYTIGVSQCSEDLWRSTVNTEMLREASFRSNMDVKIRSVKDDSKAQIRDIRSFIEEGVDLLVVSPNESEELTPVVSEAYDRGIPIILLDRKTGNNKYTAYVGADNHKLAFQLGLYAASVLEQKGNIVEVRGLKGSTADEERHRGFMEAISRFPDIRIVDQAWCNFLRDNARDSMAVVLDRTGGTPIDLVFAMNDQMAIGVHEALQSRSLPEKPTIIGIDGLFGKGGGIEAIDNESIDASFIYPTGGETVIDVAWRILTNAPFDRENILSTAVIDRSNIRVITLQNQQIFTQQEKADILNSRLNSSQARYLKLRGTALIAFAMTLIAILILISLIRANAAKNRLNHTLNQQNEDIKKQVEELESQKRQLISLSKQLEEATQAKLVFFTDISHDFKTPLTLITGPVQQLLASEDLSDRDRESLDIVQRNGYRLMNLLSQILEFRTYEQGKMRINPTVIRLDLFLEEINDLFSKFVEEKQILFEFLKDESDYEIPVDTEKIEKIYFNLLSNAFKFVPSGGSIRVTLSQNRTEGKQELMLSVFNSGSYIEHEKIDRIFERFYHLDNRHGSSGIGLALTQALVRLHKGNIKVSSDKSVGTTFTVTIPIKRSKKKAVTATVSEFSRQGLIALEEKNREPEMMEKYNRSGKPAVLVIEDNPDMRAYIQGILEADYFVILADNGDTGLQMVEKYLPDVIVSDVMMPGKNGLEVSRQLKASDKTRNIPLILLSAWSLDDNRIDAYESGADAFISKPFNADVLKTRIRTMLARRKNQEKDAAWMFGDREKKTLADEEKALLQKFTEYVDQHIGTEISIDDLAAHLNMSRTKFYREFNKLTDQSPVELINQIKVNRAAALLLNQRMSVSEVAFETGFSTLSYFTKVFTKYFDMTPSEYIRQNKVR